MGHTEAKVQVVLAVGNDPSGDDFSIVLVPTVQENGPQDFCLGAVTIPSGMSMGSNMSMNGMNMSITPGSNGTIQVVTSGDDPGQSGLYNCADVTFTNTPLTQDQYTQNCNNATGVRTSPILQNEATNANGTGSGATTSASSGESATTTGSSASGSAGSSSQGIALTAGLKGVQGVIIIVMFALSIGLAI